jgi:hypothetical protein
LRNGMGKPKGAGGKACSHVFLDHRAQFDRLCLGCRDVREDVPNGKFTTWRIWPQWRDRKAISSLFAMRCGHNSFLVVRARERAMHPGRLDV